MRAQRAVRVVAPEIDAQMPPPVERIKEKYAPRHLDDAALVFAATNSRDVNDAVTRDAHERGILVNQADDPAMSDFTTPAQLKRGLVTIAVSAGSPASPSRFEIDWRRYSTNVGRKWRKQCRRCDRNCSNASASKRDIKSFVSSRQRKQCPFSRRTEWTA